MSEVNLKSLSETVVRYERAVKDAAFRLKLAKKQKIDHYSEEEIINHYLKHAETLRRLTNHLTMKYRIEQFGYYSSPEQTKPVYDPGIQTPCLLCGKLWTMKSVRTISLVASDKDLRDKSYFYRVHKKCHVSYLSKTPDVIEPPSKWLMTYTTQN